MQPAPAIPPFEPPPTPLPMSLSDSGRRILWIVGLYFVFGLASFWWVQMERLPLPLPHMLFTLLFGDVFFLGLVMFAGGGFGAPLPILLFPQLAAAGWLLRQEMAFFQAGFASIALL